MKYLYKLIFKLRLEEFLAILLFIPMVIFMFLYHDKNGFYKSDIDRLIGTIITFIVFLGIIKTKELKFLKKHIVGQYFVKLLQFLREILPFGLCILIYTNMHNMVHLINPNDIDPLLIKIDQFLLGVQPGVWLEQFISKPMTDYMYFSYSMFFIYPMLLPALLYFKGDYKQFRTVLAGTILTFYIGYIGYVLFPAVGPKFTLTHLFNSHLDGGIITDKIGYIMNYEISEYTRRDCFPSLHNGVTMLVLLFSFKYLRWFFYIILPFAISLFVATLYLRYHYFIDMIAGYILAVSMFIFAPKLEKAWNMLMNRYKST